MAEANTFPAIWLNRGRVMHIAGEVRAENGALHALCGCLVHVFDQVRYARRHGWLAGRIYDASVDTNDQIEARIGPLSTADRWMLDWARLARSEGKTRTEFVAEHCEPPKNSMLGLESREIAEDLLAMQANCHYCRTCKARAAAA